MSYVETFTEIFTALNKYKVLGMIIGGTAVGFHGYIRKSTTHDGLVVDKPDLDIWYSPSVPNYFNLLNALEEMGFDVGKYRAEQSPRPDKSIFRFNLEACTLDFLPGVTTSTKFREAYLRREKVTRNGVEFSIISLDDLIAEKQMLGREKDLKDIEQLKAIKNKTRPL